MTKPASDEAYDVVMCVAPNDIAIAALAIRSLLANVSARKLFVVTARKNFSAINAIVENDKLCFVDEARLIPGITLETVQSIVAGRTDCEVRPGWFFQQFLKMGMCFHPHIADHYLIWDSDTLLLRKTEFLDADGRALVAPTNRNCSRYFDTMERLLGYGKQVDYSFVAEHLVVKTQYMQALVSRISPPDSGAGSWVGRILCSIDANILNQSCFSEYETYGSFVAREFPASYQRRSLRSTRTATQLFGRIPNRFDLYSLMASGYDYATFESWQKFNFRDNAIIKLVAFAKYFLAHADSRNRQFLANAKYLAGAG